MRVENTILVRFFNSLRQVRVSAIESPDTLPWRLGGGDEWRNFVTPYFRYPIDREQASLDVPFRKSRKTHNMFSRIDQYILCTYLAAHRCNINKPLNLDRCLLRHPSTMSEDQIRRWGNREPQKLPTCKQTWNHTFCFNPGQPHHLISMYKRTSEYKRASKYKWHERLKYVICHKRKVTWQLSCRDWSLMPSWPSSAAKGSLWRICWPLGALGKWSI